MNAACQPWNHPAMHLFPRQIPIGRVPTLPLFLIYPALGGYLEAVHAIFDRTCNLMVA